MRSGAVLWSVDLVAGDESFRVAVLCCCATSFLGLMRVSVVSCVTFLGCGLRVVHVLRRHWSLAL